jgi:hypothetical protein
MLFADHETTLKSHPGLIPVPPTKEHGFKPAQNKLKFHYSKQEKNKQSIIIPKKS